MSKVFIDENTLIGIGNAIREKTGTTDLIKPGAMATAIRNLPNGGSLKKVPIKWTGIPSASNCTTATVNLSSYIGTSDDQAFLITIYGGKSGTYYDTGSIFYDGAGTFTEQSSGAHSNGISDYITVSNITFSSGILSIKFNSGVILGNSPTDFDVCLFYVG